MATPTPAHVYVIDETLLVPPPIANPFAHVTDTAAPVRPLREPALLVVPVLNVYKGQLTG